MNTNDKNLQTLIFGLLEHSKSRLEIICEYVSARPEITADIQFQYKLNELISQFDKTLFILKKV